METDKALREWIRKLFGDEAFDAKTILTVPLLPVLCLKMKKSYWH